ncbi:MAG TPA: 50S ribosomal protein L20, partial [Bacteroidota bacterium]
MPRSQNKVASHRRRKKILGQAKGYWGGRSKVYTIAKNHVEKALAHAYRHRKTKKREFRGLWVTRINAAARMNGTTYSRLMYGLEKKQ